MLLALASQHSGADAAEAAGGLGFAGAALLALGLAVRRGVAVTAGLALLGAGYAASLVGKGLDPAASLFAGGGLLVAELSYWALEPGAAVRIGREATVRRALLSLSLAVGAVALGTLLLGVSATPAGDGLALGALGVGALALVFVVVLALVHSLRPRGPVR
jgi:hypothetical protein